MISWIRLQVVQ